MIKVFLAEDQLLFAQGLNMALSLYPNIAIVGTEQNGLKVADAVKELNPDILLLDINMPGMDGINVAKQLHKEKYDLKIIVLSSYLSKEFVLQMLALGVKSYLHKNTDVEELVTAINEVYEGGVYHTEEVKKLLAKANKKEIEEKHQQLLTPKELQILSLLAQGESISKIAEKLVISSFTVESHKKNIQLKLGIKGMAALVKYAAERGLI